MMAIAERVRRHPLEDKILWHLPAGERDPEAYFDEILCGADGEGIAMPGPRENKPMTEICPDCADVYHALAAARRARFTGIVG